MKLTTKVLIPILAVSLSQIARALTFSTVASGDWSNPASWDGNGVADTYSGVGDTATINVGNVINYNDVGAGLGYMTTPTVPNAGGFAISNTSSLTIDGGTLTQTTLAQEMRIGEGKSGGVGTGTLTIQTGGVLNTGASVGLGVGTKISGANAGDGLLDIKDGSLVMGSGAVTGGLGIGIQGSVGVMNVGDGGGASGTVDLATNGIQMGVGVGAAATGTVNIKSDGVLNFGTGAIYIGQGGGTGTLTMVAGATMTGGIGQFSVGRDTGSNGTFSMSGGTATLNGETFIGVNGGTGTFGLSGGTFTLNQYLNVGRSNGGSGSGTINQTGGALVVQNEIRVGWSGGAEGAGNGTYNLSAGTASAGNDIQVGVNNASTGTLAISGTGAMHTTGGQILIGYNANGILNMSGGSLSSDASNVQIGVGGATGVGVATISAGTLTANQSVLVGNNLGANGTLNLSGTGVVNSGNEWQVGNDGGIGVANISGGTVNAFSYVAIGRNTNGNGGANGGNGTVNLSGTGVINKVNGNGSFDIGSWNGGNNATTNTTGTLNQTGGTILDTTSQFNLGRDTGTVGVWNMSAGTATLTGQNLVVGNGGTGTLNLSGTGSITGVNQLNAGANGGSTGLANINFASPAGVLAQRELYIGNGGGGSGVVNVLKGTLQTNEWVEIGRNGGTGTLNITGANARWERGTLAGGQQKDVQIGYNGGNGTVNVSNGGTINHNWWFNVARGAGSVGQITVDGAGSTINQSAGQFNVGEDGTGSLIITNGGVITTPNDEFTVARNNNSSGVVNIASGGKLHLGDRAFIGRSAGSTGTLNVAGVGSEVTAFNGGGGEFFRVASGGANGTVNVTAGATLATNNGWFTVGENNNSVGNALISGAGSSLSSHGLIVGWNGSATGTLTIENNAVYTNTGAGREVSIGRDNANTQGTININSGGILNAGRDLRVGNNGIAHLNLNGGTLNSNGGWAIVGDGGSSNGFVNMTGASTFNHPNDSLMVANNSGAHGTWTQSGTSVTNIGNELNIGRAGGIGVVNVNGGAFNVNGWTTMGRDGGSGSGTLNVSGTGVFNHLTPNGGDFLIGWTNGSTGAVNVTAGGTVNYSWWTRVGVDGGSTGSILVDGAGSTFNNTGGRVYIGEKSTGTLTVTNGGKYIQTNGDQFNIGGDGGNVASGTALVSGANSAITTNNFIRVGYGTAGAVPAVGLMTVSNGGTVSSGGWIGFGHEGGDGTLNMNGGTLTTVNELYVGIDDNGHARQTTGLANIIGGSTVNIGVLLVGRNGGSGTVNLSGGSTTTIHREARIGGGGIGSGGLQTTGTLNIAATNVAAFTDGGNDFFRVASGGAIGNLSVTAGGTLTTNNGWFTVGENDNSVGTASVSGTGSTLHSNGLIVGWNGSSVGTLTIANNAVVTNVGHEVSIGRDNSANGTININSGGVLNVGNNGIDIGANNNNAGAQGTVLINNGSLITTGGELNVGRRGNNGILVDTLTVNGASSNLTSAGEVFVGRDGARGTLTVNGGTAQFNNNLSIGNGGGGSVGVVEVNGAAAVMNVNGWTTLGRDIGGAATSSTLNVKNGGTFNHTPNNGDFLLGWQNGSTAAVNVTAGGTLNYGWWTRVGVDPGSTGAITVDGATSKWNNTGGRVFIGESGNGTLNITNGGKFTMTNADWFVAGGNDGANSKGNGIVTISGAGSALTSNNFLAFGRGRQDPANLATGTLNMNSGSISSSGSWIGFGTDGGQGTANISGTATGSSAGETIIGRGVNSIGTFNLSGTAAWTANGEFQVGNSGGTGTVNMTGGTLQANSWFAVGRDGGTGVFNLSGGTVTKGAGQSFDIGVFGGSGFAVGTGTLNQSLTGALISTGSDTNIGRDASGVGVWNMSAGTATLANLNVGNSGNGTLNISGTGLLSANEVRVAQNGGSTGTINATGGTIYTNDIVIATGGGTVNFAGGTFKAKSDSPNPFVNFTTANSELAAGGVKIDTDGHAITWTNTFDGVGAITKTGNGNLFIPAQATAHTGGFAVNQGSLSINENSSLGSGAVVINGGRVVLGSMGLIEGHILGNSFDTTTANPGGGVSRIFQDRANSNDAAAFGDNSTWVYTGKFVVTGNSNVTWTFAEQFDDSVYLSIDANAGIINDNSWNTPTKTTQILTPGVHTFEVRLGQGGGGVGPNNGWALGFGYDPQGRDTLNPTFFQNFTDVTGNFLYHDFAGTTTLANNVVLNAASSEVNVPFTGMKSLVSGVVSGNGGLTKTGNGKLSLTSINTYLGGTVINGGILNVNSNAALGNVAGGVAINNNAILQADAPVTTNRTITLGTGGGTIDTNGQIVTLDTGSTVTGTSLTEAGSGVLNIKGTQTYNALTTTGGVTNIYSALGTGTSTITANATTNIYASQNLSSLTIADGVEVTFGDGLPFGPEPGKFGGGSVGVVPEPASLGLLLVGTLGLMARRRRSR